MTKAALMDMPMINVETIVPEDLYFVLQARGFSREVLTTELNRLLAIRLFQTKVLSLGQAARLARLSLWAFIELLGERQIPVVDYSAEELDWELENLNYLEQVLVQ